MFSPVMYAFPLRDAIFSGITGGAWLSKYTEITRLKTTITATHANTVARFTVENAARAGKILFGVELSVFVAVRVWLLIIVRMLVSAVRGGHCPNVVGLDDVPRRY
jgi:hypothetical protein